MVSSAIERVVVVAVVLCVGVLSCYTPIKVKQISSSDLTTERDGVPFYFPKLIKASFVLTKLEREGTVVGVAPGGCEPIPGEEYVSTPDLGQLYLIRSHDFFFGSNTFGVTLEDGVLTSVNNERDPQVDELITAVAGAATSIAGIGAPAAAAEDLDRRGRLPPPDCNSGKRYLDGLPNP